MDRLDFILVDAHRRTGERERERAIEIVQISYKLLQYDIVTQTIGHTNNNGNFLSGYCATCK